MKRPFLVLLFIASTLITYAQSKITLEDIYKNGTFRTKSVQGLRSMNDGKTYVSIEVDPATQDRFVARNNYKDGEIAERLFSQGDLIYEDLKLPIGTDFSENEEKILIAHEKEAIYRRSSKAYYYVFDIQSKKITPVSQKEGKQMYATFSPDASKVAFVRDNNLFITDLESGEETQITTDGKYNEIINGGADWVYEEEFAFARAFFWSPDGNKIAFYRFDEREVREFSMMMYENLYPEV